MRWMGWILLVVVPLLRAETPVSVDALAQFLVEQRATHQKDAEIANRLAAMVPTERLSEERRQRLVAQDGLGKKSASMLELLAERSVFLPLPASEISSRPAPDLSALQKKWDALRQDVAQTAHRLPDFMATREIYSSDNLPNVLGSGFVLHARAHDQQKITYRDGRDAPDVAEKHVPRVYGLVSSGEFGEVLLQVFGDLRAGRLRWSHWEEHAEGAQMVLRYEIAARDSHFRVRFPCCSFALDEAQNFSFAPYDAAPAYHGEIAIDEASGSLRRLTVEAEFLPQDAPSLGGIAIEYRPVEIGGRQYVCPVRSVALLAVKARQYNLREELPAKLFWINAVRFVDYHRLGAEVRILPD